MYKTNSFHIANCEDLKTAYKILSFTKDETLVPQTDNLKNYVIGLKRDVRNYYKKKEEFNNDLINIFDSDYDSFIELRMLPEYIKTQQEAIEYFEENLYIHPTYSMYDCTGKPFTSWFKICKRNNRFYAYHRVNFDV